MKITSIKAGYLQKQRIFAFAGTDEICGLGLGIQQAQYSLFIFMFGSALGTIAGGPIGDRFGRKRVILGSVLGAAPFSLALPFLNLPLTLVLIFIVGFIIASALPGR